ncbi:hypothetical protein ACIBSW_39540 [Actinoplanes sp. NPDC049668]|uniref:hypothetical protein n=1 Tax=unclassified Actinoplanes TaxID=2626549 RepID=UPI0033ACDB2E
MPEALLWSAVGDLDVIERLGRHAHQVRIPVWTCVRCELAWPCTSARRDLLVDLGWHKVAIYSAVLMERAAKDLTSLTPKVLWHRFLEWTEPPEDVRDLLLKPTG